MRILHLVHQYMPEKIGGTELYTRTLARQQRQLGHHVAIFTPSRQLISGDSLYQSEMADEGVIYRVPVGPRSDTAVFAATFQPTWSQSPLLQALANIIDQEKPDLIHIQHLMGIPAAAINVIKKNGRCYLVTLHDYWHLCANAQLITNYNNTICAGPNWWLNCARCALARIGQPNLIPATAVIAPLFAYREHQLRRVLNQAASLIAPTHFTADTHIKAGISPQKINVIPHGIALPTSMPDRTHQPTANQPLHIGYIGGLSWQKGVHILIEAVNQLPTSDVTLTIYGDPAPFPDYVTQLHQTATHPAIHFAGRLPHADLWATLVNLDVVVVPSLWYETASLIVQEAFAAGVPVIASDVGALKERVVHGVDGYHFPPGDVDQLAHYLQKLYHSLPLRQQLKAGIKPVQTIAQHTDQILAQYHHALAHASR